jgi:hypothetical protein
MLDPAITKSKLDFIKEARRTLAFFQDPVWAATKAATDPEHLIAHAETLAKTRQHHADLPEKTEMHMVIGDGDVIFALAGNSPDAAERARAIVGFLRSMPYVLEEMERGLHLEERVDELLRSNNETFV